MKIFEGILSAVAQKRAGVFVSRPVINGEAWAKWAEKHKIPNPVPAEQMHLTVIASRTDVKCKAEKFFLPVETTRGVFGMLGTDDSVLAFIFSDCCLSSRHYFMIEHGAVSDWPTYRPHITLSYDAKGFELTQEMIEEMPAAFVLGFETFAEFNPTAVTKKAFDTEPMSDVDAETAALAQKVRTAQLEKTDLSPYAQQTLDIMAAGGKVETAAVAELLQSDGMAAAFGLDETEKSGEPKFVVLSKNDEEQVLYGWANVSMKDGTSVRDVHGDETTTAFLKELCHDLVRTTRASKFEHVGEAHGEIVEAIVFTDELVKALGESVGIEDLSFGQEGLFVGIHFADPKAWAIAKTKDMLSIAAEAYYEELP